jgi:hypothetical protein
MLAQPALAQALDRQACDLIEASQVLELTPLVARAFASAQERADFVMNQVLGEGRIDQVCVSGAGVRWDEHVLQRNRSLALQTMAGLRAIGKATSEKIEPR